jgi:hypothetical protein
VQHRLGAVRRYLEHDTVAASAACRCDAIKIALCNSCQAGEGLGAVVAAARESVKNRFSTGVCNFERGASIVTAALLGRTIEISLLVHDQTGIGRIAVSPARKRLEHGFGPVRGECEYNAHVRFAPCLIKSRPIMTPPPTARNALYSLHNHRILWGHGWTRNATPQIPILSSIYNDIGSLESGVKVARDFAP